MRQRNGDGDLFVLRFFQPAELAAAAANCT
jgi:hypothetical protein